MPGLAGILGEGSAAERRSAIERMVAQARAAGGNAVVNVRFSTSNIASGAAEVMAYGTAVWIQ